MKATYRQGGRGLVCVIAFFSMIATGLATGQEAPTAGQIRALIDSGEYEVAVERARAAALESHRGPIWNVLGEALFAVGDLDAAREAFERAQSLAGEGLLEATLNLGLDAQYRGDTERAARSFRRVLELYSASDSLSSVELSAVARAAQALGVTEPGLLHDAVRVYGEALSVDSENIAARVALGNLLLTKYNNAEALEVFREALEQDPSYAPARLGLARSQHFDHTADALTTVSSILETHPNYVPARAFLARLLIESEQYDEAERETTRALAVNANSLETLAVLASVYYFQGEEEALEATVARCLSINPKYADLYTTLAELSVQNRLYHDAVRFARRAVTLDPNAWRAYGLLGLNELRLGNIEAGRASLERAFDGDPFNIWTKNTLDLLDTMADYKMIEHEKIVLLVHREEAELLAPYVIPLAQEAYDYYVERYQYRPDALVRIELYPDHSDFSVRTVGLAGLGILGVSFGPVVALDSPSARPIGSFNWGSALWHELAHTFHLGATRHRVPRWFSEGLAVYEEQLAREGWGGDVTPTFLEAYRDGQLLPVSELNKGFVRPSYPEQIQHSYYQSSLVFAFIDERWGFNAIAEMLAGYRNGRSTADVVRSALGLTLRELDAAFDAYFRERFGDALAALTLLVESDEPPIEGMLANPTVDIVNNFEGAMRAGTQAFADGDLVLAEVHLLRAQALFPEYADSASAYWYLAQLYMQREELEKAAFQLQAMIAINAEHYEAHLALAGIRERLGDPAGAVDALSRAMYIYPFDPTQHERLAALYEGMDDWTGAARAREAVVALNPVDMAQARYELAHAYRRSGQHTAARREVLRALEIAPSFPDALELLLELRADEMGTDGSGAGCAPLWKAEPCHQSLVLINPNRDRTT